MGSYVMSAAGRLEFCEGPLLTAMRRGQWLIADELNLAPSEILEAFNRYSSGLLDALWCTHLPLCFGLIARGYVCSGGGTRCRQAQPRARTCLKLMY